jgi:hypothetical protein
LKNVHSDLLFNEYLRVSSDTDISDDEEDEQDDSSYDSFIDDRINPTVASSPAESCGNDMMAIYRCFSLSLSEACVCWGYLLGGWRQGGLHP